MSKISALLDMVNWVGDMIGLRPRDDQPKAPPADEGDYVGDEEAQFATGGADYEPEMSNYGAGNTYAKAGARPQRPPQQRQQPYQGQQQPYQGQQQPYQGQQQPYQGQQQPYQGQQQYQQPYQEETYQPNRYMDNVVPLRPAPQDAYGRQPTHTVVAIALERLADCESVIRYAMNDQTVYVRIDTIQEDHIRRRAIDMLSGAAFALNAHICDMSNGSYFILPDSVQFVDTIIGKAPEVEMPQQRPFRAAR